jgi:hypothetical protein
LLTVRVVAGMRRTRHLVELNNIRFIVRSVHYAAELRAA